MRSENDVSFSIIGYGGVFAQLGKTFATRAND
jgi:hypothetical protein